MYEKMGKHRKLEEVGTCKERSKKAKLREQTGMRNIACK
jgi:hypothetical protein